MFTRVDVMALKPNSSISGYSLESWMATRIPAWKRHISHIIPAQKNA